MMSKTKKLILIAVATILVVASCIFLFLYTKGYSGLHNHTEPKEGQIKVACVGDSITYGHGISGWARNNYPAQLQKILGDGYHVANFGHSGRTLSSKGDKPYIESKQFELSLEYDADIVIIMLGSNDSKPQNWQGELAFMKEYEAFIDKYKENNPDVEIILCTPAKAFFKNGESKGEKTKFDIRPDIVDTIRYEIRAYALVGAYKWVDIYGVTEYRSDWFRDYVHPSADGARAIAEAIANKIKK